MSSAEAPNRYWLAVRLVAREPEHEFHFEIGRALAERLG
jgi:hypothetical protein